MRLLIPGVQSLSPMLGVELALKECTFLGSIARASDRAGLGRSPRSCILEKWAGDCEVDRACVILVSQGLTGQHVQGRPRLCTHILFSPAAWAGWGQSLLWYLESPPRVSHQSHVTVTMWCLSRSFCPALSAVCPCPLLLRLFEGSTLSVTRALFPDASESARDAVSDGSRVQGSGCSSGHLGVTLATGPQLSIVLKMSLAKTPRSPWPTP